MVPREDLIGPEQDLFGLEQMEDSALRYAAEQGDARAAFVVGLRLEGSDRMEAMDWLLKATRGDDTDVARLAADEIVWITKPSDSEIESRWRRQAEEGDSIAACWLGMLLAERGELLAEAHDWLVFAAEHAYPRSRTQMTASKLSREVMAARLKIIEANAEWLREEFRVKLDTTFNGSGAVFVPFGRDPGDARAMCIQQDGRVIVAGTVGATDGGTPRDIAVVRVLPDGTLDDEFGVDGRAIIDVDGRDDVARAVALQDDGKIVVAGESLDLNTDSLDLLVVRLNPNGRVDTGFNGTGFVLADFLGGTDDGAYAVTVQKDGRIVAAGYTTRPHDLPERKNTRTRAKAPKAKPKGATARSEYFALARLNEDGSRDETFGDQGLAMTAFEGDLARAEALLVQPTGEIVAAGFARSKPNEHATDFAVARYQRDGTLDSSFGADGLVLVDVAETDNTAHALSLWEDGRIVVAGSAADKARNEVYFALVTLEADGSLDSRFHGDGAVLTQSFVGGAYGVAVEPDGAILAAGYGSLADRDVFALVRYCDDGSLDNEFGEDGVMLLDLGGVVDRAHAIARDDEGKILVAGTSRTAEKTEFALARLTSTG